MENIEKIQEKLNTRILGRNIIYLEEIDSTQEYIKRNEKDLVDGTIVITDNQTKGKGTKGRIWYTKPRRKLDILIFIKTKL